MKYVLLSGAIVIVMCSFGCSPKLAQTPLGPEEVRWEKFVKKYYPEWKAPETIPPGTGEEKASSKSDAQKQPVFTEESVMTEEVIAKDASGKVVAVEKTKITAEQKFEFYNVQKNDTLWKLAIKFYKKGSDWKKIRDANQDVLKGSEKLSPGMKLRIPLP
jgi:nucleoid-associated protein YgaU